MLHRYEGNVDANGGGEGAGPLPGADDHGFAFDASLVGYHRPDHAFLDLDALNLGVLTDRGAGHARAAGEGHRDVARVRLAVGGQEGGAHHVVDLHQWPQLLSLSRREQVHLQSEALGGGGLALDLRPAFLVAGEAQPTVHLPPGCLAGLGLEGAVELDRVAEQLGDVGARAQLADETGGMKGGARGELVLLDQHCVCEAQLGEVVRSGAADDAATDHHHPGM